MWRHTLSAAAAGWRVLFFGAAVAALACQPPSKDAALGETPAEASRMTERQIVVAGGTVVTFDSQDRVIEDGAVAVIENRIVAIGPAAEIESAYPEAERINAYGGIIMPGLINAHTHVPMVLFRGLADDVELMDWLEGYIFPAEAEHVDEDFVRWGTRLACLEMLRGGITTFVDMYYFDDVIAEEADRCGMRAVVGETLIDFPAPDNKTWEEAVAYTRRFVERWREHPRITPAVAPHAPYTVSAEHLVEAHRLAEELDVPLLTHLAEHSVEIDRVRERTGQTSIDYLENLGILDDRMLAAHVVWPTPSEIELLAERGVGVAHCPESNMKVVAGVAPVPAMLEAGVAVGIGTDGAGSNNNLDLWDEIDTAAKLHKLTSGDPTVLNARQALSMATREGARALGLEDEIGSLEIGKRADLIVVSVDGFHQQPQPPGENPYSLLVYATRASDVETVMVDGRVVVRDGWVLTLDATEIRHNAAAIRRALAGSSG
jgi:5-methylthioadenosine/S-adenosylhomocysteine deaminase